MNDKCNPLSDTHGHLWMSSVLPGGLEASGPKNHVCAFLGHPSALQALTGELNVNPDHTIDTMQTYCDFAIGWLEWTQDLNILSFVQRNDVGTRDTPVSSWVPMWNA